MISNDMRRFMTMTESFGLDNRLVADIKLKFHELGLHIGEERNPDGLPEDEIIGELIEDAETLLDWAGATLHLYRAISVPDLTHLRGTRLGQSWSLEEEMALPYKGDHERFYRLHGRVQAGHVDRRESIIYQVVFEEREVVLAVGAPVLIDAIMLCMLGREEPVASELIGQMLAA